MADGNVDLTNKLVAKSTSPLEGIKPALQNWFANNLATMKAMLGNEEDAKKLFSSAWHSIVRSPQLLQCTKESLYDSLLSCAAIGLFPGPLGECALVAYKDQAQMQPMYKGLLRLAHDASVIKSVNCNVVYEKDTFEFEEGFNMHLLYRRSLEEDRGKRLAVYCCVELSTGGKQVVILSPSEIQKVRNVSRSAKSDFSPWNTWEDEMWKKTALKRALKLLPSQSKKLADALSVDDEHESPEKNNKPIISDSILDTDTITA